MARKQVSTLSRKPRGAAKGGKPVNQDIGSLLNTRNESLKQYGTSENTKKAYQGHLKRGQHWLAEIVADAENRGVDTYEGMPVRALKTAFDGPPTQYSVTALELFLVQKCFTEGLKKGTADGIHAAFAEYWEKMDGQTYAGEYSCDKTTGAISGCPARAPAVQNIMQAIKTRAVSKGAAATRQHAEAMNIEDFQAMIRWSESICSNECFETLPTSAEELRRMNSHGFMRGFCTTAFNLFTRNFETASIQFGDITFNCRGPAPFYLRHFTISLEERKGWQKQAGYEGPRTSNIYEIYEQDIPEIDVYSHLLRWITYLETRIGRPLERDDYIFPQISGNGIINPKSPVSYDIVQSLILDFTRSAGLTKVYTSHCFRRGGAQYRFMFAPIGKRWSLSTIRWWGGWAIGEHVDTLMKYLVDSLQSYETGHGDALRPIPTEAGKSFMGDHLLLQPASSYEIRLLRSSIDDRFNSLMSAMSTPIVPQTYLAQTVPQQAVFNVPLRTAGSLLSSVNADHPPPARTSNISRGSEIITDYSNRADQRSTQVNQSSAASSNRHLNPPIPGVIIPDIRRGPDAWKKAINQWENASRDMPVALKDWPLEWYTGPMKDVTGAKRSQRRVIYDEYIRLERDDSKFLQLYPEAERGISQLLKVIRMQTRKQRLSKNGHPTDRK